MLVAIPTVNKKVLTRHFGRMTEVTFLKIENHKVVEQFFEKISEHDEHSHNSKHNCDFEKEHSHGHENKRHQEILSILRKADKIVCKSICKNWEKRLAPYNLPVKKVNSEMLSETINTLISE